MVSVSKDRKKEEKKEEKENITYSLPDIHLGTAGAGVSFTGVGVTARWLPSLDVSLHSWLAVFWKVMGSLDTPFRR